MRQHLATWLRRLADYLDPPKPVVVPNELPNPFSDLIRALMREQEVRWPERSGEAKRHQVMAVVQKTFNSARARDIAYEIERVMQEH